MACETSPQRPPSLPEFAALCYFAQDKAKAGDETMAILQSNALEERRLSAKAWLERVQRVA